MNYGSIASSLKSGASMISDSLGDIHDISFGTIWSGNVYEALSSNLETSVKKIEKQKQNVNKFADALEKLQTCVDNNQQIFGLRSSLDGIENNEENAYRIKKINKSILTLQSNNKALKEEIKSLLSGITPVNSEFELVKVDSDSFEDYKGFVSETYDNFQMASSNKNKRTSSGGHSLYDYYMEEEVDKKLNEIKSKYTGREAAVNCALGIMQMATDVGLKLDNNINNEGSDFAAWAVQQGANETFVMGTTEELINAGKKVAYEDAQKGDILVYDTGGTKQVVMIFDNDPDTQQFLLADSQDKTGVTVKTKSYASLSGTYQARDLSIIYNNQSLF